MEEIKITITLEYDKTKNGDKPSNIFLYQFLTRLDRDIPIRGIEYKGKSMTFKDGDIVDMPLKKIDSLDKNKLPKDPEWLKNKTVLPPRIKKTK